MPAYRGRVASSVRARLLLWLLVLALPIQALAASVWAVKGPTHMHRQAGHVLKLQDTRRDLGHSLGARPEARSWFGHQHASASPERHRHALGDASVVLSGDDALVLGGASADDSAASASAFLAVLSSPSTWQPEPATERYDAASPAPFSTRWLPRLERPPRA